MEAVSGIRIAHSFIRCGRPSLVAKQDPVLLGLQQKSASVKCCKNGFLRVIPKLKASVQDGTTTENTETVLEAMPQTETEKDSNNTVMATEGPTVQVKFVLEKRCKFGQRFNVVGNDPLFGNWEVEGGIPMTWGDGDIWTVDVSVPVEKQFEFKFVLTGKRGEVVWQPGANRLFETKVDISSLVVNESWESVDEAVAAEVVEKNKDPLSDTSTPSESSTTAETNAPQVPVVISDIENASKDLVKSLESKVDGINAHAMLIEPAVDAAPEGLILKLD